MDKEWTIAELTERRDLLKDQLADVEFALKIAWNNEPINSRAAFKSDIDASCRTCGKPTKVRIKNAAQHIECALLTMAWE